MTVCLLYNMGHNVSITLAESIKQCGTKQISYKWEGLGVGVILGENVGMMKSSFIVGKYVGIYVVRAKVGANVVGVCVESEVGAQVDVPVGCSVESDVGLNVGMASELAWMWS